MIKTGLSLIVALLAVTLLASTIFAGDKVKETESYLVQDVIRSVSKSAESMSIGGEGQSAVADLLPDIIVRESDLYDHDIQGNLLRLSNGTANVGEGKLYLYGVVPPRDSLQDVMQRIYRTDGSYWDRLAGQFVYHQGHSHIHFQDWAQYRLREVLPDSGVGQIVAEGSKTSFCIMDLAIYDPNLPNFDPDGQFHSCSSTIQGLSVGWIDIYSKGLSGQNIDITGVPDGYYWLESEVDPLNHVLEASETNNITRILITLGTPDPITPDSYEPNDNADMVDSRPAGGPNSPNLGPCNPERIVAGLNIHASGNEDYFKFYSNHTGGVGDLIRIDFQNSLGDIDMRLLNSNRVEVAGSNGTGNFEQISLQGRPEGWYYIRIFGYGGATNPFYSLTVNPPSNNAPSVTVINPPVGNIEVIHGIETYTATWSYSDPESDQCWVTVYANDIPQINGNEFLFPTSLFTDASLGSYVINTSYLPLGTYWIFCEITDGGTTTGSWSNGTITLIDHIHDIQIAMFPNNAPITVPAGGSFSFTGILENGTDTTRVDDVWIMLDVPNVGRYGPISQYNNIALAPYDTITVSGIVQNVPLYAPLGSYNYIAFAGNYPSGAIDSASFSFTVIQPIADVPPDFYKNDWNMGDWFDSQISSRESSSLPKSFSFLGNYPNPFNPTTTFKFVLPTDSDFRLDIYNILGQKIVTLADGYQGAGEKEIAWDASEFSSGVYFYKLSVGDQVFTKRMMLLK